MNHFIIQLRSRVPVHLVFACIVLLFTGFDCDCSCDDSSNVYSPPLPPNRVGAFAESLDGGGSWPAAWFLDGADELKGGSFTNVSSNFVIVGESSEGHPTIWTTADSAFSWTVTFESSLFGSVRDVTLTATGRLVAVSGTDGIICTSDDDGLSWVVQHSAGTQLRAVDFSAGTNIGIAVGEGGSIFRSTDGGTSWASMSSGTTHFLEDVHCFRNVATDTMIAVGGVGTVVRSTDAGLTWMSSTPPTSNSLVSVSFSGTSSGRFGVAEDIGSIYRTSDGGATWEEVTTAGSGQYEGVIVSNDGSKSLVVLNGDNGPLLMVSTDQGHSWGQASVLDKVTYVNRLVPMDASLNGLIIAVGYDE